MRSKQNIPFPWDEFNQQRLYVTFESYEDFEDFVTFLAKKRNHYWAKQKAEGLRELWNLRNFAITANAVKPLSVIDKQIVPYGRYFYTSPVLDDVEREWLKNFTSLFKNAVFISVTKHTEKALNGGEDGEYSYLTFSYNENGERMGLILPSFKTADMYKGMVNGHVYDFDKLMENKG